MRVQVVRSERRHKTVQARVVDGVLRVAIPAGMSSVEEEHWVVEMQRRVMNRADSRHPDLVARASRLAGRFGLPHPASIEWSARQTTRWGSASIASRKIRISERLVDYPRWVLDYVIVHELAHLKEANHSPAFWRLVRQYPQAERAQGYLIAKAEQA